MLSTYMCWANCPKHKQPAQKKGRLVLNKGKLVVLVVFCLCICVVLIAAVLN